MVLYLSSSQFSYDVRYSEKSGLMFHQGNVAFIDEDYDRALELYSKAVNSITDQQEVSLTYSFRAAVHLKLKNYSHALDDCNAALKLNVRFSTKFFVTFNNICFTIYITGITRAILFP